MLVVGTVPRVPPSPGHDARGPLEPSIPHEHRICEVFSAAAAAPLEHSTDRHTKEVLTAGGAPGRGDSRTRASPSHLTWADRTPDRGHLPPLLA